MEWFSEKCVEIKELQNTDVAGMYKKIEEIAEGETC